MTLADTTSKVVELLTAFTPEERLRIVKASLTLMGDELPSVGKSSGNSGGSSNSQGDEGGDTENYGLHSLAKQWMKKNNIAFEQLEHYFHFDQGKIISIALPGNASTKKDKTINAYITQGLAAYLATGEGSFSDADARKFCEQSGCYDNAHHALYVKALTNRVSGSKSTGWKLTAPGLSAAADLIAKTKP